MQVIAAAAGRQDHPFADAEAHLARREVGNEHDLAADEFPWLAIRCADTGKNLPLPEIASVEQEAQQLVRAVDETAFKYRADAQVELGEVVDGDGARLCGVSLR